MWLFTSQFCTSAIISEFFAFSKFLRCPRDDIFWRKEAILTFLFWLFLLIKILYYFLIFWFFRTHKISCYFFTSKSFFDSITLSDFNNLSLIFLQTAESIRRGPYVIFTFVPNPIFRFFSTSYYFPALFSLLMHYSLPYH